MPFKQSKYWSILKGIVFATVFCFMSQSLIAAWVENIPTRVTQPSGVKIELYRTGDEFHNWLHDIDGYSVIQDAETGVWCWAVNDKHEIAQSKISANHLSGEMVSTGFPIDSYTPSEIGLTPFENISKDLYLEKRNWFMHEIERSTVRSPSVGIVNSIVIFIRFFDDEEFGDGALVFEEMFNGWGENVNSMFQYFWDASYQLLEVYSPFFPLPNGSHIVSYQSPFSRSHFQPYHPITNPDGYQGGNNSLDRVEREQGLLRDAVMAVQGQIPQDMILDANNDGYVDNVNFMIKGDSDDWADLLWPHRWALFNYYVTIHGKQVWDYNFNIENFTYHRGVGVLAHEFAHTLGLPDFYRYHNGTIDPIGRWCLMASDNNPPQSISAYAKYKYTGWINEIPTINTNGIKTLFPLSTHRDNNFFRINTTPVSNQFYVVEYRSTGASFIDANLWGTGLIVYRINDSLSGNADGPPDEMYIYRPNGSLYENGTIQAAHFSAQSGRTEINEFTNPMPFLENELYGGLDISEIGYAGETISFYVNVHHDYNFVPPKNLSASKEGKTVVLSWQEHSAVEDQPNFLGYKVYRDGIAISTATSELSFTDSDVNYEQEYNYFVVTTYDLGESKPSNNVLVKLDVSLLPVTDLEANVVQENVVILTWEAPILPPDQTNLHGYRIYRDETPILFTELLTFSEQHHEYGGCVIGFFVYEVTAVYIFDGTDDLLRESEPVSIEVIVGTGSDDNENGLPIKAELLTNYPNPFNPETTVRFNIVKDDVVNIDIFNIRGQKIKILLNDFLKVGYHEILWDGTDENRNELGSGIYFYRMQTNDFTEVKKMILMK